MFSWRIMDHSILNEKSLMFDRILHLLHSSWMKKKQFFKVQNFMDEKSLFIMDHPILNEKSRCFIMFPSISPRFSIVKSQDRGRWP